MGKPSIDSRTVAVAFAFAFISAAAIAPALVGCGDAVGDDPLDSATEASRKRHHSFDAGIVDAGAGASAEASTDAGSPADGGRADVAPTPAPSGDAWYVSTSGSGADGKTWATAWNELDRIDWNVIEPGDRIEIGGGTYTKRLVPTKGGTANARITIERSTEIGHDGKVTFDFTNTPTPEYWSGYVTIHQPYLTIDGKDWNKFDWIADSSCLFILDDNEDADAFTLKNVRMSGYANPDNGGTTMCIFSGSLAMDRVWFGKQVGAEDHIKFVTSSHSSLKVEHSVFTPWISINGSHSDLIEQCWPGCQAGDLVFKHNLVWDSGPGGGNIVFTLDPHWASVDVSYNVFKDTYQVFQFTSRGGMRISNNVFDNVFSTIGGDGTFEAVNNVFVAPSSNTSIVWGSTPRYSLWAPGTYGYFSGNGTNLVGDPSFLDSTNVLGADGVPFTADDGFNLRAGSAAIDRGTPTIDVAAMGDRPIVGQPDIGAYEYQ
jgi:hypothetical protein